MSVLIIDNIDKNLISKINQLTFDYIENDTDYNELAIWFKGLKEFPKLNEAINKNEETFLKYKKSRDSMEAGDKSYESSDYLDAIASYNEVLSEDKLYYEKVQLKIDKCIGEMYDYYIREADKLDLINAHKDAYNIAKQVSEYYPDDSNLKSKMDTYLKNLYDWTIKKAEEYNSVNNYDAAIEAIGDIDNLFPGDSLLTQKKAIYEDNRLKAIEEEKQRRERRKNELLAKTSKRYDKELDADIYVPQGYSTYYVNLTSSYNIEPRLFVTVDGVAMLMVFTGFISNKYLNFNSVVFQADDETFEWETPDNVKKKQNLFGEVGEWSIHSSIENFQLIEQMKKMSDSDHSKIIFTGDENLEHTLTLTEKNNLKLFVELSGFYVNLDTLIEDEKYDPLFPVS
jgi:tetratricopeptide (TPR) repeat protein